LVKQESVFDHGHDPQNGIMILDDVHFWQAVQDRDKAFDGQFFFGVMTTGVIAARRVLAVFPCARMSGSS